MKNMNKSAKNKTTYALLIIVALTLAVVGVSAYGMMGFNGKGQGMMANKDNANYENMGQMHEQMESLLEAKDYQGFLALHKDYGMNMDITEEQFLKMAKWHEAVEENDFTAMQQMKDEGFAPGFGMMKNGQGKGMMGKGKGMHSGGCPMMQ